MSNDISGVEVVNASQPYPSTHSARPKIGTDTQYTISNLQSFHLFNLFVCLLSQLQHCQDSRPGVPAASHSVLEWQWRYTTGHLNLRGCVCGRRPIAPRAVTRQFRRQDTSQYFKFRFPKVEVALTCVTANKSGDEFVWTHAAPRSDKRDAESRRIL